jgi:hypothetical protein
MGSHPAPGGKKKFKDQRPMRCCEKFKESEKSKY